MMTIKDGGSHPEGDPNDGVTRSGGRAALPNRGTGKRVGRRTGRAQWSSAQPFSAGDPMASFPQSGYDGVDRQWKLFLSDPER
jgi:hypothetical protein